MPPFHHHHHLSHLHPWHLHHYFRDAGSFKAPIEMVNVKSSINKSGDPDGIKGNVRHAENVEDYGDEVPVESNIDQKIQLISLDNGNGLFVEPVFNEDMSVFYP